MLGPQQKTILQNIISQCIDITNETEYCAHFEYVAHCEAFDVRISVKGVPIKEFIYYKSVISVFDIEKIKEITAYLDRFLMLHSEYQQEQEEAI